MMLMDRYHNDDVVRYTSGTGGDDGAHDENAGDAIVYTSGTAERN